jgi:hypothetical protein
MPAQDRTGPMGHGPLTGRGLGPCGRGLRRGFGFRSGFRFNTPQTRPVELNKQEQIKVLEEEKAEIENELNRLKNE